MHSDGAVVARVGIGQNGFRTIFGNDFLSLGNEFGPCFFPSDAAPLVRTLFADAFHRVKNAIRGIGVLNIGQPLYAGTSSCLGLLFSAAYVSHAAVLNAEFHQAAVSTVAQATVVLDRTSTLVEQFGFGAQRVHRMRSFGDKPREAADDGHSASALQQCTAGNARHCFSPGK